MNSLLVTTLQVFIVAVLKIKISNNFELLLLHNNNINFHFEEDKEEKTGGAGRALHLINKFREEARQGRGPPVLYLNAGDSFSHTRSYTADQWELIADYLNVLRPDAICLGNHDLNLGLHNLTRFLQRLQMPVVTSNIDFGSLRTLKKYIKPSYVLTINKIRIGIIGVTTSRINIPSLPKQMSLMDEIESVRIESSKLYELGLKIIILLSHSGGDIDETIARTVEHIDVVVTSRRKSFTGKQRRFRDIVRSSDGKNVPIIHEKGYLKTLGVFKMNFNDNGDLIKFSGEPISLHGKIPEEQEAVQFRKRVKRQNGFVGVSKVTLSANCHKSECNLGNLVTDALCDYKATDYHQKPVKYWTDFPIAMVNAGALRRKMRKGTTITSDVLKRNIRYDDTVVYVKLKGIHVKQVLLQGVQYYGYQSGYFLQVSGLHIRYNMTKDKTERVTRLFARCGLCHIPGYSQMDDGEVYHVIVNSQTFQNIPTFTTHILAYSHRYTRLGEIVEGFLKKYPNHTAEEQERLIVEEIAVKSVMIQPFLFIICIALITIH